LTIKNNGSIIIGVKTERVDVMKIVFKYLKPAYFKMVIALIARMVAIVGELSLPYILSHILKNVILQESVEQICLWGSLMILCSGVALVLSLFANRIVAGISRDMSYKIRRDLFAKTLRLSAAQIDRFTIASLESRITTDTYHVHNFVRMVQMAGIRGPVLLAGGLVITMIMDIHLSLVMFSVLPFVFAIVYFIRMKGIPLYTRVQKAVDNMVRIVREDAQGIRVIKALSKDKYEHKRYDEVNRALVREEEHANVIMGSVHPIMTLFMNMGIVAVVAVSASRVANLQSDPETIIVFMQYFTSISMAMMMLTRLFVMTSKCSASAKRIEEVLMCEEELQVEDESKYPLGDENVFVEFENVSFSYNGKKPDVEDINFKLYKGQSLGIIGATGSGKSTLVKLLLRFYDVDKGNVRINGRDIRTINREELYKMFGTAMQNDFLYADTIEENINFGRNIDKEDIIKAAKIAQAHDFISEFPEGYQHMLSQKGTNVSGGQKQRILISRAVVAGPEILILDDSSSALDYKTEANLRNALEDAMKDTTVINVAQRVSAVKNCDLILVVDEGRIIGRGTHDELMETCDEYKEISDSQMGGAFVE